MRTKRASVRRYGYAVLLLTFLLLSFTLVSPALAVESPEKRVLLLHSYHQGLAWTDEMTAGARSVFDTAETPVDLYVEYMDTLRLGDAGYGDREEAILGQKFAGVTFDLVICLDDTPFISPRTSRLPFSPCTVAFCYRNVVVRIDLECK